MIKISRLSLPKLLNKEMVTNIGNKKLARLILPYGMRKEIAKSLEITERTVSAAVQGRITGRKSAAARRLAELKLKELNEVNKK
jgi:hypothetical protein